jgi:translation initiation factor IF-3
MNNKKLPRTNNEILDRDNPQFQVRLLDENGEMLGVFTAKEALKMAYHRSLDLIEISPNASPPVCKIGDFGRIKYEMQKKLSEERKKNKIHDVKEVKFTINIGTHDYDVKMSHIKEFVENGHSVKISCMIRGRDRTYGKDRLAPLFEKITSELGEIAMVSGKVEIRDNGGDFTIIPKVKK